jgi:hypothetical protein
MGSCRLRCACILGRRQFHFFHCTGIQLDDFLLVYGVHHMSTLAIARKSLFLAFLGRDALSERNALRCTSPFNFEFAPQMNKEHFMVTWSSSLGELHLQALTQRYVNLSIHTAWGIGNMDALGRAAHRVVELSRMHGRCEVGGTAAPTNCCRHGSLQRLMSWGNKSAPARSKYADFGEQQKHNCNHRVTLGTSKKNEKAVIAQAGGGT